MIRTHSSRWLRHGTLAVAAGASLLLAGCATRLYQWGDYEDSLYAAYKDPAKLEALRQKLEAHIQAMEKGSQKVAPGLYAEVGTLYLQAGQRKAALAWYQRERAAWPESAVLMTSMIQNLERLESGASRTSGAARSQPGQEAAQ